MKERYNDKELQEKIEKEYETQFDEKIEERVEELLEDFQEVVVTIQTKGGKCYKCTMSYKESLSLRYRLHKKLFRPKYVTVHNRFTGASEDILVKEIVSIRYSAPKIVTKAMIEAEDKLLYDIHIELHGDEIWLNGRSTAEMNDILDQYNDRTKCVLNIRLNNNCMRGINRPRIKDITVKTCKPKNN